MTFEELKKEFIENGFQIDGNTFIHERVDYSTININGQIHQQPHTTRFTMVYIGESNMTNESDSDWSEAETLYEFDIIDGDGSTAVTIFVRNFEEFTQLAS